MRKIFTNIYFLCQIVLIVQLFVWDNDSVSQVLIVWFSMLGALLFLILDELEGYRAWRNKIKKD